MGHLPALFFRSSTLSTPTPASACLVSMVGVLDRGQPDRVPGSYSEFVSSCGNRRRSNRGSADESSNLSPYIAHRSGSLVLPHTLIDFRVYTSSYHDKMQVEQKQDITHDDIGKAESQNLEYDADNLKALETERVELTEEDVSDDLKCARAPC